MSFISEKLTERRLPALGFTENPASRRLEILDILSDNIYGRTPSFKSQVSGKLTYRHENCFAGHAKHYHYDITVTTPNGNYTFPLRFSYPKSDKKVPLVISIGFDPLTPSGFIPEEEICQRGVGVASFFYEDITDDRYDDFKTGIAPLFPRDEGATNLWGKIGMWAWAASRVLDFLLTLDVFDENKIAVEGHSRLGKTALWCAAQDERFTYVFSNNAGCSGDAITRGKQGETIEFITRTFGYWFCSHYRDYKDDAIVNMPFDQHFLLAAIAPRYVAVGASGLDTWADPESEFLNCHAASDAWKAWGKTGFIAVDDRFAVDGDSFNEGSIAFHQREGSHTICRADWNAYLDFMMK